MEENYNEEYEYEKEDDKKFHITRGMLLIGILLLIIIIVVIIIIVSKSKDKQPQYVESDFKKLESRMEEEAPNYLEQKTKDPDNGELKVDLKDLLVENGGAIDPKKVKAAQICEGYVLVTGNEKTTYTAYIKCKDYYTTKGYKNSDKKTTSSKKEKDVTKPDIVIKGDEKITINVGSKYEDQGATVVDNVDGDITSKMKTSNNVNVNAPGTYLVTYSAVDAAGNRAEKSRTVIVVEVTTTPTTTRNVYTTKRNVYTTTKGHSATTKKVTTKRITTPPTLTLKGNNSIVINLGSTYKEPGYVATDATGNNITSRVVISGSVNTSVAKTYTIKYTVSDTYGNTTSKSRIVKVSSNAVKLNSISVTPNSKTLEVGQTYKINVIFNPSNASNKSLTWTSNNSNVASVSNGTVTARKKGTAKITVTPIGASSKTVEIIVK